QVSMATQKDANLLVPSRFSLGFMKSMDNRHRPQGNVESLIIGERAFGHAGAGGSLGFADPDCGLAFGYTMNKMGPGIFLNERGQSLADAAYRCLGYRSNQSGVWSR
ncbi:MAG: beta-lactamase family protein, partial [Proteobacteria bacterium]|nr:beta-lactamase family protein [Pseudomonadota bacterium]